MNVFLTYVLGIFKAIEVAVVTKLTGAFTAIVTELPADEAQILHDAINHFTTDRAAGKTYGEAAADALSVFFSEEKGEVSKIGLSLFNAFLAGVEGPSATTPVH